MTLYAYNSDVLLPSTVLLATNDQLSVGRSGYVYSLANTLFATDEGLDVSGLALAVHGNLAGASLGFHLGTRGGLVTASMIHVGAGASIDAFDAINLSGSGNMIQIAGSVIGLSRGVQLFGAGGAQNTVTVTGTLTSHFEALSSNGTTALNLLNSGTIASWNNTSAVTCDEAQSANDVIRNAGLIDGDVLLGAGQDRFQTTGQGRVNGTVFGGAGHDTYLPGLSEETFDGGTGVDTLDFSASTGVILALDDSRPATGWADGDIYLNVDNILGSRTGVDRLTGNGLNNRLVGAGGNDLLFGIGGNDSLEGGHGTDTLGGGTGNDAFVFRAVTEAGDLILDFGSVVGNDDRIEVQAARFGGGLVVGVLAAVRFQSRADNVAQDSDDRFVFRTTDKTLWFDVDGNGVGAAVMLADLQASANLGFQDIVLI